MVCNRQLTFSALCVITAVFLAHFLGNAAGSCVDQTMSMVGVCGDFVTQVQDAASNLAGETDAAISAAVAKVPQPTSQCCSVYTEFLSKACNCDSDVVALAAAQGVPAAGLATQTRIWKAACTIPASADHCRGAEATAAQG